MKLDIVMTAMASKNPMGGLTCKVPIESITPAASAVPKMKKHKLNNEPNPTLQVISENNQRLIKRYGQYVHVSYAKEQRSLVQRLFHDGFIMQDKKGNTNTDEDKVDSIIFFPSIQKAQAACARVQITKDVDKSGISIGSLDVQKDEHDIGFQTLKVTNIPMEATIEDVSALFPEAVSIHMTGVPKGRLYRWTKKKELHKYVTKEALVQADSNSKNKELFLRSNKLKLKGKSLVVTFGKINRIVAQPDTNGQGKKKKKPNKKIKKPVLSE